MSSLSPTEKYQFETLLDMGSGYVLNFSNQSFYQFFRDLVGVDIYQEKYGKNGPSKAKHLRAFWEIESDPVVARVLDELLKLYALSKPDEKSLQLDACRKIVSRLSGSQSEQLIKKSEELSEETFLRKGFNTDLLGQLPIESSLLPVLKSRLQEANTCMDAKGYLAAIILFGSSLEGILLGVAREHPREFNMAASSPRDKDNKPKKFPDWSLSAFIDVAFELKLLTPDVKKFSHALRDFRNYIHPYEQMLSSFFPDKHTAIICRQVLNAAIDCLHERLPKMARDEIEQGF